MKRIKHRIEAAALTIIFAVFRWLPLDAASMIGGWMGQSIGPFMSAHKTAQKNLAMIYPKMKPWERSEIIWKMWNHLGRVASELPHLPGKELYDRMSVSGMENVPMDGKQRIFFSGHIGNWELSYAIAHQHGIPVTLIYREANNLYVDEIIAEIRGSQSDDMLRKGARGAVKLGRAIKSGHSLAMLVDQKMNDGISVPFFGKDAMTAPAIAELALRYNMPLIPAWVKRTKGCHFEAKVFPPLEFARTGDEEKDVLAIMTQINQLLESWIHETPEQWFWVHKRWPNNRA